MKPSRLSCVIVLISCAGFSHPLFAQATAFEVASVKPLPPIETLIQEISSGKRSFGMLRGATLSGTRFDGMASLTDLIIRAYGVQTYRIVGPEWMRSQLFEIHAKMPEGSSKDEVPQMLQKLLAERFKLAAHWEKKDQPVYALIVSKDGHKLREAVEAAAAPAAAADLARTPPAKSPGGESRGRTITGPFGTIKIEGDKDDGMKVSTEKSGVVRTRVTESGLTVMEFQKMNMTELAERLTNYVDRPVIDKTQLKGSYQVSLEVSREEQNDMVRRLMPGTQVFGTSTGLSGVPPGTGIAGVAASDPSGGGVFRSVQKMGLKLDPGQSTRGNARRR